MILEASREEIGPRRFVQHDFHFRAGYDLGLFLLYGPLKSPSGFLAIARSESSKTLDNFLEEDPLLADHLARVEIREFQPIGFPETLRGWVHPLEFGMGPNNGGFPAAYI
jgi:hypothetical protein